MRPSPYEGGGSAPSYTAPKVNVAKSSPLKVTKYRKPEASTSLPQWFKDIRSKSDFMPSTIKPASYTYMAQASDPYRSQIYAAAAQTDVGTMYHRPSADVATEIKKNFTIWQDIKNLGGKVLEHGGNLLGRVGDLFSRGGYAIRNMYMNNLQMNYMTTDSAGGTSVTGGEAFKALFTLNPTMWFNGQWDDQMAAAWRGLSGKDKTSMIDILKVTAPKWSKEHPTALAWVGGIGDIVVDPLTWLTMGVNPGTVTRTGIAAGKLLRFDKAGAARVLQDTLWTPAGRAQSAATLRSDAMGREAAKWQRRANKAAKRSDKASAGSFKIKAGRKTEAFYRAKADELAGKAAKAAETDLRGIALAKVVARQNVNPFVALNTASRLTTGAKQGSAAIKTGQTVKEAMDAFHMNTVNALADDPGWQSIYEAMKGRDHIYTHGQSQKTYKVELSKAKDLKEWLLMVVREAAPIAKIAEHGPVAARSRYGRIVGTEARANNFIHSFSQLNREVLSEFLVGDAKTIFRNGFRKYTPTDEELASPAILKIDEDEYATSSLESLKSRASAQWKASTSEQRPYKDYQYQVIIKKADGSFEAENLRTNSRFNAQSSRNGAGRMAGAERAAARSRQERAVDQMSGVDDDVAAARGRFEENNNARQADPGIAKREAVEQIVEGESVEDAEKIKEVLLDESRPVEERIQELADDPDINGNVVDEAIELLFDIKMDDKGNVSITQTRGMTTEQKFENIPKVVRQVLMDRWSKRVELQSDDFVYIPAEGKSAPLINASRITMRDGKLYVDEKIPLVGDGEKISSPYTRDIAGEIAAGYLDGMRAGLDYAVQQELYKHDPELLVQSVMEPLGEFINGLTADVKSQVINLIYQMSGIRLPEVLVPTIDDINRILADNYIIPGTNKSGSQRAFANLALRLQRQVLSLFQDGTFNLLDLQTNYAPGSSSFRHLNIPEVKRIITELANAPIREGVHPRLLEEHDALVDRVHKLREYVRNQSSLNGTTPTINHYTWVDFLLYHKEILKAQETSFVIKNRTLKNKRTGETEKFSQRHVNTGRLSALDSFDFVDPEVRDGLEALETLVRISKNPTNKKNKLANQALAQLMMYEGEGLAYLDALDAASFDRAFDFEHIFSSMGVQAFLKEGSLDNSNFGPKLAASLLEDLWGEQTLNHEMQKALGNAILHQTLIKGDNMHLTAKEVSKSIDTFFANHDRMRRLMHPIVRGGTDMVSESADVKLSRTIETSGETRNQINASMNDPQVLKDIPQDMPMKAPRTEAQFRSTDAVQGILPKLEEHGVILPEGKVVKAYSPYQDALNEGIVLATTDNGVTSYYVASKGKAPVKFWTHEGLPASAGDVRRRFVDVQQKIHEGDAFDVGRRSPRESTQGFIPGSTLKTPFEERMKVTEIGNEPTPTSPARAVGEAEEAPVGVGNEVPQRQMDPEQDVSAANPDDAVNTARPQGGYTEEELAVATDWIQKWYGDAPPEVVARELHRLNVTMTQDLLLAQMNMIEELSSMGLENKATIRLMGQPFMAVGNPMNAAHSTAGVTAFYQARSGAFGFWQRIMAKSDPATADTSKGFGQLRFKMTRQSQLLEGALNQVYTRTVNAVANSRKELVAYVNQRTRRFLGEHKEFKLKHTNIASMSRKEKLARANELFFDPVQVDNPNWLDEFDEVQGTNALKDIEADMDAAARQVFSDPDSDSIGDQIRDMNRFIGDNRLKIPEVLMDRVINISRALRNSADPDKDIVPYTRKWFAVMSERIPEGPFSAKNIQNVNLTKLHMGVQNASLRIYEGRALYHGIWNEFSTVMNPNMVKYWNESLVPHTVRDNGQALRGELVSLDSLVADGVLLAKHVPPSFRGQNRYVQVEFVPQIKLAADFMEEQHKINSVIDTRALDKILTQFKANVTIYKIPTYPIRNLITDVFMSAMDGLVNPRYYRDATRIVQNAHKDSKAIDSGEFRWDTILDQNYLTDELSRNMNDPNFKPVDPAIGAPTTTLRLQGADEDYKLTDHQIYALYNELGLGQNRVAVDFTESVAASRRNRGMRAAGAAADAARVSNDFREDWTRLAHFVYAMEQEASAGGDLMDIARRARERVIKHHFDYSDISIFERKVLGQWVPFYKWMRNVIPYTIASVVARPYALKIEQGLQQGIGATLDDDKDDPRTDFVVPQWIENENMVDIGWYSDPNGNKFMQWMSLSLPLSETLSGSIAPVFDPMIDPSVREQGFGTVAGEVFAGLARGPISMANPLAASLIQASTERSVWSTGASPSDPTDPFATLASIVPGSFVAQEGMELGKTLLGEPDRTSGKNKNAELLKALGAIRVSNNSERSQIGELKRLQDMNRAQRGRLIGPIKNKLMQAYPQLTPDQADAILEEYITQLRSVNG